MSRLKKDPLRELTAQEQQVLGQGVGPQNDVALGGFSS